MATTALRTKLIPATDVQVGTVLAYLNRPFTVARIEATHDHPTLGAQRIAYDDRGRGMAIHDVYTATVVA